MTLLIPTGCRRPVATESPAGAAAANPPVPAAEVPVRPAEVPAVDPDRPETRWIGSIPYDVFYDRPLDIAADSRLVDSAAPAQPPVNMPEPRGEVESTASAPPVPPDQPPAPAAGSAPNWADVLPLPLLVDEVKQLRTQLTENLNTLAAYNRSTKAISNDAAILTALAAIAAVHPEPVSWQPRAKYIRELAQQLSGTSTTTGREKFDQSKELFERITTLLDGGTPAAGDVPDAVPFADVVLAADLMQRLDRSFTSLKANVRSEGDLRNGGDDLRRQLHLLLAIGTLISDRSYEYAEEPNYQQQSRELAAGLRSALAAASGGNAADFQSALARVQTNCAECHRQYRGGDGGF